MNRILNKSTVNSEELVQLLQARKKGEVDFLLVDVREEMEYVMGHIKNVDLLRPISTFRSWSEQFFKETKERTVIFTCRTGSRSGQIQRVFQKSGHTCVINHVGGIVSYRGEIQKGYYGSR